MKEWNCSKSEMNNFGENVGRGEQRNLKFLNQKSSICI